MSSSPTALEAIFEESPAEQDTSERSDSPPQTTFTWWRPVLVLLVSLGWAFGCDMVLELSLRRYSNSGTNLGAMLFSASILWVLMMGVYAVGGRLRTAMQLTLWACVTLAFINMARMKILMEPLTPADAEFLGQPGFLIEMVGWSSLIGSAVALGAGIGVLWLLVRRYGPRQPQRPHQGSTAWKIWVATRVALGVLAVSVLIAAATFNDEGNPLKAAYSKAGAIWVPWDQGQNYRSNGFIGGVLYNMPTDPMSVPEGYSKARMTQVAQRWQQRADAANQGLSATVVDDTNVVVILSESMGDPAVIDDISFPQDPIPNIRNQMENGWGGHTLTYYGTGTSAMEFGTLTGQTLSLFHPSIKSPYQQFVSRYDSYPSAVGWLKSLGHRAIAVHPYSTHMYKRSAVYDTLGFDEFIDEDSIADDTKPQDNEYIGDQAALDEVVHQITTHDEPLLTHLVTMQNHMPYPDMYDDPITPTGVSKENTSQLGQWARGLKISDDLIPGFLRELKQAAEPTVVIYFGDHFPGILDAETTEVSGLDVYKTPFFVWSTDGDHTGQPQGYVAPSAFLEVAMRNIGQALPPYLELTRQVQEQVGVLRGDFVVTPDGTEIPMDELTEDQQALIEDYRLVQYDFSVGERYAQEAMWY